MIESTPARCKVITMEIKPIRTEADYRAALQNIDQLWNATYGSPEGDMLDVLVTLVEVYEDKHYPISSPDPIETILHYMESQCLTEQDLEPFIGSHSFVSDVLSRKRTLSLEMIRNLHKGLGIPADVLIQPYPLQAT